MRIVLFGPAYPFRGGVPHFTTMLAQALAREGHEVAVVNFRRLYPRWLARGRKERDDSPQAVRVASECVFVPWQVASWKETARTIAKHDPELIAAMWWLPPYAPAYCGVIRALPENLRRRFVYVVHDVIAHERYPADRVLARAALRAGRAWIVLSRAEEARLKTLCPELPAERIRLAPHPVFESYQVLPVSAAEARRALGVGAARVLLFFGFVRRYKGLDLLLRAMPVITAADQELKLLVCGPFHERRARYERLVRKLGLGARVVIHDRYFSGADASLCFAAADAVVLPYRRATQSGVVPLAFAHETPVIATSAGGLEEAFGDGDTGLRIPELSPATIAETVRRFYELGGKAAFAPRIRDAVAQGTWSNFIATLLSVLPLVA